MGLLGLQQVEEDESEAEKEQAEEPAEEDIKGPIAGVLEVGPYNFLGVGAVLDHDAGRISE